MLTKALAIPLVGIMLSASIASAQTASPFPDQKVSAPTESVAFMSQEKAGQWRASKLKGLEVYDNHHQRVGEIRDVLVGRDGQVDAVVVGVGGFLGFNEHDVALPFSQLSWAGPGSGGEPDVPRAYPAHGIVKMTKDELLAYPEFHYAR